MLSDMVRRGIGVPKDVVLADQLREKGCAHGAYVCPEDMQKAAEARAKAAPVRAAASAAPAAAAPRPAMPAPFAIARARLGVDTVDSVERDIRARGGSPLFGGSGIGKFRFSALSGDYRDGGPDITAVNYDFDAAGASGRLIAVTIVRRRSVNVTPAPYAGLVEERKAAIAKEVGPLRQTSPTEFTAAGVGVQVTLTINPGTGFLVPSLQTGGELNVGTGTGRCERLSRGIVQCCEPNPVPFIREKPLVDTNERRSHHRRRRTRPSYSVMASVADHDFSGAEMTKRFLAGVVVFGVLLAVGSLQAHHSLAGVYDLNKVERATGVVQKFAFTNPHGALHIAIKNAQGEAKVWQLTTGSANVLVNAGLSATGPNRIKVGR